MFQVGSSLKSLVLKGSLWTIGGHGASQLLRLIRGLIMTRLLFPEAYGLMSLVWAILYGLQMMSDVGLVSAIIRDKRGDDPDFLNTCWTINVIRGAVLAGAACLLAYPIGAFYGQPELTLLILAAALNPLVNGFQSMALWTSNRHMDFKRLTLLSLGGEIVTFAVLVLWAYLSPTVWALLGGALIGQLFYVLGSYVVLKGIRHRFRWEPASVRTLVGFGKWIFFSSALYFLAAQGDRMLLGHYLDLAHLGVYGIAMVLYDALHAVAMKINNNVLFPAYAKVLQAEVYRLKAVVDRARLGIDVCMILPIAALMILGERVVGLLYDARYHEAGWIFQILCVRLLMACANLNSEAALLALGQPQYGLFQNICRASWILVSIPIGWTLMGLKGVVWAVALTEVPVVVVLWIGLARNRMPSLAYNLRSLLFCASGALLGFGLMALLP